MLENLSPAAVETIAQIVLAVILLLASAVGIRLGINRKNGGEEDENLHEIKGAIISDRKADEIIRAFEEVTRSNHELCGAIHSLREGVRDAKQELKDTLREFRQELQYTLREIRR
jgi:hypothetical protein